MAKTIAESVSIVSQLKERTGFLTTTEVMGILGITRQTLCGWVRTNRIAAVRIGKDNKFDPHQLSRWIEARQTISE